MESVTMEERQGWPERGERRRVGEEKDAVTIRGAGVKKWRRESRLTPTEREEKRASCPRDVWLREHVNV